MRLTGPVLRTAITICRPVEYIFSKGAINPAVRAGVARFDQRQFNQAERINTASMIFDIRIIKSDMCSLGVDVTAGGQVLAV